MSLKNTSNVPHASSSTARIRDAWRGLFDQITLSESFRSRGAPFVALALTHAGALGQRQDAAHWQRKCLEYIGFRYLELLIAHLFVDSRPDCTAAQLSAAVGRKTAIVEAGEAELHLAKVAHLPADWRVNRECLRAVYTVRYLVPLHLQRSTPSSSGFSKNVTCEKVFRSRPVSLSKPHFKSLYKLTSTHPYL